MEVCNFNEIHNVIRGKGTERLALAPKVDYAKYVINQILDVTEKFYETETLIYLEEQIVMLTYVAHNGVVIIVSVHM